MELRVLQYFLAVVREQSISGAANYLHLSQPTLSRQLMDLEDELGKKLFIRGNRKITLTDEGMTLRKRAEEILELVKKAENEISLSDNEIAGDIYIGAGESESVRILAKAAKELQDEHPQVHVHISSGDSVDVIERLDRGLIDFGLVYGAVDLSGYDHMHLPVRDTWGVLMRRDSELAQNISVAPRDLWDKPLILSRQQNDETPLMAWLEKSRAELNVAATYSLLYNGSLMVSEGVGYALCFDRIINVSGDGNLCFRPLSPKLEAEPVLIRKKYQILSKAAEKFLEKIEEQITANI